MLDLKKMAVVTSRALQGDGIFRIFLLYLSPGSEATGTREIRLCVGSSALSQSHPRIIPPRIIGTVFMSLHAAHQLILGLLFTSYFLGEPHLLF